MRIFPVSLLSLAAVVACTPTPTPTPAPASTTTAPTTSVAPAPTPAPADLKATLTLAKARVPSARDLVAHVTVTNVSAQPIRYRTFFLRSAQLHLECRAANGTPQHPGPPPTPTVDDGTDRRTLAPGESMDLTFRGSDFFQSLPAPGAYELRFRDHAPRDATDASEQPALESDWVKFDIAN